MLLDAAMQLLVAAHRLASSSSAAVPRALGGTALPRSETREIRSWLQLAARVLEAQVGGLHACGLAAALYRRLSLHRSAS